MAAIKRPEDAITDSPLRFPRSLALKLSAARLRVRIGVIGLAMLTYALLFVLLFPRIDRAAVAFLVIPVILSGVSFGIVAGPLAGLLAVPLNLALFALAGDQAPLARLGINFWMTHLVFLFMGTVSGAMSDLWRRLQAELDMRKRAESELEYIARHDPLTGTFNRYSLNEILEREFARAERYKRPIGILMVDINRFKEVNDRFGHQMGDRALMAIAEVLQTCIRETDFVIRYGGDEFIVVLPETNGETEVVLERIRAEISRRNVENPLLEFPVTLAIGAIHYDPDRPQTSDAILQEADRLMYLDKGTRS